MSLKEKLNELICLIVLNLFSLMVGLLKLKPTNIGYIEKLHIFYSMDTNLLTTEI